MNPLRGSGFPLIAAALAIAVWLVPFQAGLWTDTVITDIPVYQRSSDATQSGELPYRDATLEYPPGAAVLFWAARFMPGDYEHGFRTLMMIAWALATAGAVAASRAIGHRITRQLGVAVVMACVPLLLGNLVATRFDAIVTALVAWIIVAAVYERWRWMWGLVAVAVLIKLSPALMIPALMVWQAHRSDARTMMRGFVAFAFTVVGVFALIAAAAPSGVSEMFRYHLQRPVQIESLASSYMLLLHNLVGVNVEVTSSYGSQGLGGSGVTAVAGIITAVGILLVLVLVAILLRGLPALRTGPDARLMLTTIACTVTLAVTSAKVFSPQFMLWLLPAVFLAAGPYGVPAFGVAIAALVTTQVYFPHMYWDLVNLEAAPIWVLVLRNALMLVLIAMCWPRPRAHLHHSPITLHGGSGPATTAERAPRASVLTD